MTAYPRFMVLATCERGCRRSTEDFSTYSADGFYINVNNIPAWCHWVHYLSFMHYGVKVCDRQANLLSAFPRILREARRPAPVPLPHQAASANQFRGLVFTCTPEEAEFGCIATVRPAPPASAAAVSACFCFSSLASLPPHSLLTTSPAPQGDEFLVRQGFVNVDVWANVGYLVAFSVGNRFMSYLVRARGRSDAPSTSAAFAPPIGRIEKRSDRLA